MAERVYLSIAELSVLLALVRGAQDDDDSGDTAYSAALSVSAEKLQRALRRARAADGGVPG
jgi:hypothetical protein